MLLVMGFALTSNAQRATLLPLVAGDTLSTSSSIDTVQKTITITAGYAALGIQTVCTKISGTVSAKAYLYGSIDGSNWDLTDSSSAFANQTTNTATFTKTSTPYVYYRVDVRPMAPVNTTQAVKVRVYYVARKHD